MADGRGRRTGEGPALLAQYLEDAELSYAAFGKKVACTKAHVCGLVTRRSSPSLPLALRIEKETRRKVPSESWPALRKLRDQLRQLGTSGRPRAA